MDCIIVTRHKALAEYMLTEGIAPPGTPIIPHAKPIHVQGAHVYGVLPLRLAALAFAVTEVPLRLEDEDLNREIGIERLRQIAGQPVTYHVQRL